MHLSYWNNHQCSIYNSLFGNIVLYFSQINRPPLVEVYAPGYQCLWGAGAWGFSPIDNDVSLTQGFIVAVFCFFFSFMIQKTWRFFARFDSVMQTCAHTYTQSLSTPSKGHFTQSVLRKDVITSLTNSSALLPLEDEWQKDYCWWSAQSFFFILLPVFVLYTASYRGSRYLQKVAHRLHYHCPSCSCKHVLVGRKRWGTREEVGWREVGRNKYIIKE